MSDKEKQLNALLDTVELIQSGYVGIDSEGRIVDRRKHEAVCPIPKNRALKTPEPKVI